VSAIFCKDPALETDCVVSTEHRFCFPACRFSGAGSVFLTNYRLVFVPKKPTPQIQAIELPLLFIDKQDVRQPVFGANNLRGVCRPVDAPASGELIKWRLSFTNGGMGTMVPLFYSCLEYIRVSSRHRQQAPEPEPLQPEVPPKPPSFLATALLDPSDPTTVYLTQPVESSAQSIKPPQFPVV